MEMKLLELKAAIAAVFAALGVFLGWKGILALAWVVCMLFDYISGTAAACKAGEWSSKVAREGLWHKGGMIIMVMVSFLVDMIMLAAIPNIPVINIAWPAPVFPLVLSWYIFTEIGSVIENAGKMGAPVPEFFVKIMKVGFKKIDEVVSKQTE